MHFRILICRFNYRSLQNLELQNFVAPERQSLCDIRCMKSVQGIAPEASQSQRPIPGGIGKSLTALLIVENYKHWHH